MTDYNLAEVRKLSERACGTDPNSEAYRKFLAAMTPTLLLDLTGIPSAHQYQALCSELYQVLGELGASEKVLDKVLAAAEGVPIPDTDLLPYVADPLPTTGEPVILSTKEKLALIEDMAWQIFEDGRRDTGKGRTSERLQELSAILYDSEAEMSQRVARLDSEFERLSHAVEAIKNADTYYKPSFTCRLFGCKTQTVHKHIGVLSGRTVTDVHPNCLRCGRPNPNYGKEQWH